MIGRRGIIVLWIIGLALSGAVIVNTRFSTDMSAFLPRSPSPAERVLVDQLREGVASRLILLAIEGAAPDDLGAMSRSMADQLRASGAFGIVNNGDPSAFERDRDLLWRNRYLLSPAVTPEHFTGAALHEALEGDLRLLNSDLGMLVSQIIPADPTGEMRQLLARIGTEAQPETSDGVWMSPDHHRALLMVQTLAPGFDLGGQDQALDRIEMAFRTARGAVPEATEVRLIETGPPVFAVRTRDRMKQDVRRLSAIASLLVAAILLLAYRSARMLVLAMLPVLTGVIAGVAMVGLGFGFVHGITLGFGVTLIGEAVDYAIYLFTQTERGSEPATTLKMIWPTLRLGMLTSVCGFSAMLFSSFVGFAQLGLFTIVGLVVALAMTRWVLPALLPPRFPFRGSTYFASPLLVFTRVMSPIRIAVPALGVLACVAIGLHTGPYWEEQIDSMSPLSLAERTLDEQLRRETGAPDVRYFLVATASDRDQALAASERIARHLDPLVAAGKLAGFDFPAAWLPSMATQKMRQAALPPPDTLSAALASAIAGTPFREDVFKPFLADIATAAHQPMLRRQDLDNTNLGLRLDSMLLSASHGWVALLPLRGVTNPSAVSAAVAGFNEPGLLFLDLRTESDHLLGAYLHEALTLSVVGAMAVLVLLAISLRSTRRFVAVSVPLAAAVACTAALLLTISHVLSIFNLFGLLLVVAVGSNYCLFFARPASAGSPRHRVVASIVLANLCTVIGFGLLSFSRFPVLHGIGETVSCGAFLCLLFAAVTNESDKEAEI
jgi:predicted exporter